MKKIIYILFLSYFINTMIFSQKTENYYFDDIGQIIRIPALGLKTEFIDSIGNSIISLKYLGSNNKYEYYFQDYEDNINILGYYIFDSKIFSDTISYFDVNTLELIKEERFFYKPLKDSLWIYHKNERVINQKVWKNGELIYHSPN